jgi:hypothetical protein
MLDKKGDDHEKNEHKRFCGQAAGAQMALAQRSTMQQ